MSKVFEKWKFLSLFLVLFMVLGVVSYGRAATKVISFAAAQPSGAASVMISLDKEATTVGGEPVNIAINLLNAEGGVNTSSNGQHGDCLIEISSQLGNLVIQSSAVYPVVPTAGQFAFTQDQYVMPAMGVYRNAVNYGGQTGTDTITVKVYESITKEGAPNHYPGALLAEASFSVTVGPGVGITQINSVVVGNDNNANGVPDLGVGNVNPTAAARTNPIQMVWGRAVNAEATASTAGQETTVTVRTPASQAGTVRVYFIKVGDIYFNPGDNVNAPRIERKMPSIDNAVATVDVDVVGGVGASSVNITEAGFYLVVANVDNEDGTVVQQMQGNWTGAPVDGVVANNVVLHYVRPVASPVKLSLSASTNVMEWGIPGTALDDATVHFRVDLLDQYDNPTPALANTSVSFTASLGTVSAVTIPLGASHVETTRLVDAPGATGIYNTAAVGADGVATITATATGLTGSDPVQIRLVANPIGYPGNSGLGDGLAAVAPVDNAGADDDADGIYIIDTAAGSTAGVAGYVVRIGIDDDRVGAAANQIPVGTQFQLKLVDTTDPTSIIGTATATLDAAKTEQSVFGGNTVDNDADDNDYILEFQITKATGGDVDYILEVASGAFSPVRLYEDDATINEASSAGYAGLPGAAEDWNVAPPGNTSNVIASGATSIKYVDLLGRQYGGDVFTKFDAGNRDDNAIRIWGAQFLLSDTYGNSVAPAGGGINTSFTSTTSANYGSSASADGNANGGQVLNTLLPNTALNAGYSWLAGGNNEVMVVDYPSTASGSDTLTFYFTGSVTPNPMTFDVVNIGNPYNQIIVSSLGQTEEVYMPLNGSLPIIVETRDASGNLMPSDNNDLVLHFSPITLATVRDVTGAPTYNNGFAFDTISEGLADELIGGSGTNGRAAFRLDAGATEGDFEFWVTQAGGTVSESNHLIVHITTILPLTPSEREVSVQEGESIDVSVVGGTAPYTVTSSDETVATATISDGTITITGVAEGSCTITVTDSSTPAQTAEISVTVTPAAEEYPILDLRIDPLMGTPGAAFHFTDNITDPNGAAHISVDTIQTGTEAVDIYVKCTYPDGQSAWLYFDPDGLVRFHDEPAPEWSNMVFDELTDYALIHGAWWFDKSKEAEWNLPKGEYTWEITVVKAGGSIDVPEDIVQTDSATLTLE